MMIDFDTAVWTAVGSIPPGKVATYGSIAKLAGHPKRARAVGRILSKLPEDSTLPWHRVINAQGKLSFEVASPRYLTQKARLQEEGVYFTGKRINLTTYLIET